MKRCLFALVLFLSWTILPSACPRAYAEMTAPDIENDCFALSVARDTGAITSLVVKETGVDIIGEKRLAANFRINLPLPDLQSHYIDGMAQKGGVQCAGNRIDVTFSSMSSDQGAFPLTLTYSIVLEGDTLRFKAQLTNPTAMPVAEFWFPRLGGWDRFDAERNALLATPNYIGCANNASLFRGFPGGRGLGAEAAEMASVYPGIVMPWWDVYDAQSNLGLYLGYHDETFRLSTWHLYLFPNSSGAASGAWMTKEQAQGAPVGLVFSHVRYPYIKNGETLDSGEFILRLHRGDWHAGSQTYGQWFRAHFPIDKSSSWLRKQSAWFTSILYQPEDKVVADFKTYGEWCRQAKELADIHCFEAIGWHHGGIERGYPDYTPDEKLGGPAGFAAMLEGIDAQGGKCLAFANYNVMDSASDWYQKELAPLTHQDAYGKTPNWMAWGEGTLTARLSLSVRRHVLASAVPAFNKIIEERFVNAARMGAHGLQLDKVCVGSALDFNPMNALKPDVALCEGLVQSMKALYDKCREVRPDFCFASEASQDRLIPFVDVFYRNAAGFEIAPLRYVFPEWTACQHVSAPYDFNGVNGAVATGAVLCVEPNSYQDSLAHPAFASLAEYIKETGRIREELADTVFLGGYYDKQGAAIFERTPDSTDNAPKFVPPTSLMYRVHGNPKTGQLALVVANTAPAPRMYLWQFSAGEVKEATLYAPFEESKKTVPTVPVTIPGERFQIVVTNGPVAPESLCLRMRCGDVGNELPVAKQGYDARVLKGFTSAWGPKWVPPVYHCRASETEVGIELTVPKGSHGTLRMYVIDPDQFFGGRRQEILVNGASLGTIDKFEAGRWIERPYTGEETKDGHLRIQVVNRLGQGNAVISIVECLR